MFINDIYEMGKFYLYLWKLAVIYEFANASSWLSLIHYILIVKVAALSMVI
jgi:hypothetical protein